LIEAPAALVIAHPDDEISEWAGGSAAFGISRSFKSPTVRRVDRPTQRAPSTRRAPLRSGAGARSATGTSPGKRETVSAGICYGMPD
jgi:hypothetical protein